MSNGWDFLVVGKTLTCDDCIVSRYLPISKLDSENYYYSKLPKGRDLDTRETSDMNYLSSMSESYTINQTQFKPLVS